MKDYDPMDSFDAESAAEYEDHLRGDEAETVDLLAELAGDGPVLELAIGTGRIAVPLAARGVRVDGIDLSTAMVDRLRAKPGGAEIDVTIGDYADVGVEGTYRLVYLIYNTLGNLLTQDAQVRCFENVAKHLTDDGCFLVESQWPEWLTKLRNHQYVDAEAIEVGSATLDIGRYDPITQVLDETHVELTRDGIRLFPIVTRQVWPAEMDLMARVAGLRLRDRWSGWRREPFTADSKRHVSVYAR